MLSERIESLLNEQVNKELFSSYLYLSMSAYMSEINMNGYANWFRVQAQEEKDHAMIIYNYIISAGGRVKLKAIEEPQVEFDGIKNVLELTLEHERFVTSSIYKIYEVAMEERDYKTVRAMDWFINEQVEEEDNATDNIAKYDMFSSDPKALYLLDQELGSRVYTIPPQLSGQA